MVCQVYASILAKLANCLAESRPDLRQRFSERLVESKRGPLSFADVINGVVKESTAQASPVLPRARTSSLNNMTDASAVQLTTKFQPQQSKFNLGNTSRPAQSTTSSIQSQSMQSSVQLPIPNSTPTISKPREMQTSRTNKDADNSALVANVTSDTVNRISQERTRASVQAEVAAQNRAQEEKDRLTDNLSHDLVTGVLRNIIHDDVFETYGSLRSDQRTKRSAWRRIKISAREALLKKRRRQEEKDRQVAKAREYQLALEEITKPARPPPRKRARLAGPMKVVKQATVEGMALAAKLGRHFWEPVDLSRLFQHVHVSDQQTWRLVVGLASPVLKSWFKQKFGIVDMRSTQTINGKEVLVDLVDGTTLDTLSDVGALIFVCSKDFTSDRATFIELVEKIARNSETRFPVMIVSAYEAEQDAISKALCVSEMLSHPKSPVTDCQFCKFLVMEDIDHFDATLVKTLQNTSSRKSPIAATRADFAERVARWEAESEIAPPTPREPISRMKNSFYDYSLLQAPPAPSSTPVISISSVIDARLAACKQPLATPTTPSTPAPALPYHIESRLRAIEELRKTIAHADEVLAQKPAYNG